MNEFRITGSCDYERITVDLLPEIFTRPLIVKKSMNVRIDTMCFL